MEDLILCFSQRLIELWCLYFWVIIKSELIFMYAVKEVNMLGTVPVLIGLGGWGRRIFTSWELDPLPGLHNEFHTSLVYVWDFLIQILPSKTLSLRHSFACRYRVAIVPSVGKTVLYWVILALLLKSKTNKQTKK